MAKSLKFLTAVFDILTKKAINIVESAVRPVPQLADFLRCGLGDVAFGGIRWRASNSRNDLKRPFDSSQFAVH
jgi:hypothetical protein